MDVEPPMNYQINGKRTSINNNRLFDTLNNTSFR